jgi:hypothetical protein
MHIDFEESDCEEMPDLKAVWFTCVHWGTCDVSEEFFQGEVIIMYRSLWPHFDRWPTKGTEGEKSVSGSEDSDPDDELA